MATPLTQQKMELEGRIGALEQQIYNLERSYLEQTVDSGNVLRGWTEYLTAGPLRSKQSQHARKHRITDAERLFSLSSVTSPASRALEASGGAAAAAVAPPPPSSPVIVTAGPTPHRGRPTAAAQQLQQQRTPSSVQQHQHKRPGRPRRAASLAVSPLAAADAADDEDEDDEDSDA